MEARNINAVKYLAKRMCGIYRLDWVGARGNGSRNFPKNILVKSATGKLLHNAHNSRHLLAEFLFSEHHIFMQTFAKLRSVKIGCSDVRCFAASPFGLCLCLF